MDSACVFRWTNGYRAFNLIDGTNVRARNVKYAVVAGLVFAIQVMFDQRIALLTIVAALTYSLYYYLFVKQFNLKLFIVYYLLFIVLALLLHAFWVLPSLMLFINGGNVASIVDTTRGSIEFFSFAKFENALGLLHPNWPENVFGKVNFMRPEFLLIPIVAFSFLLFRNSKSEVQNTRTVLFFALLALVGTFFAKGTQEPFGGIFVWLYSHVPGFNLFRDPVKFYILIAFAYSLIIPYSIERVGKFRKILSIVFVIFWAYLLLPFINSPNVGIFKQRNIPEDYVKLKNLLVNDNNFSRTLWIPQTQRFGFVSDTHPALSFKDVFKEATIFSTLGAPNVASKLSDMSIKYVIVPFDSEGEIFLNDRKYNDLQYQKILNTVAKTQWLQRVQMPGRVGVFKVVNAKPHFYIVGSTSTVQYQRISPSKYDLRLGKENNGTLIFSEQYDKNWYIENNGKKVNSKPYEKILNSFEIPKSESGSFTIFYEPQKWTEIGYFISFSALALTVGFLILGKVRKKS